MFLIINVFEYSFSFTSSYFIRANKEVDFENVMYNAYAIFSAIKKIKLIRILIRDVLEKFQEEVGHIKVFRRNSHFVNNHTVL